ncbi:MAG: helix-turn-helix domain-containing protein [Kiloniellales bacterium]
MDDQVAIGALSALAQGHRLRLFRLLVREGPSGLPAGEIGERIGVAPSALSFHLAQLERAGLLRSWRVQRNIYYAVEIEGMRQLLGFLTEDCCQGRPEICGGVAQLTKTCASQGDSQGDGTMEGKIYNVMFLCTGNSARSIIGEAILNRLGAGKFRAFSAGSQPKGRVHPYALEFLANLNHPTAELRSKSWDEFTGPDAPALDFVFTLCDSAASEPCPAWPGQPMTAHWGLPDPAAVVGSETLRHAAFADTYRMLNNRIGIFVNLPFRALDRLSLQRRLTEIGSSLPHSA